MGMVCTLKRVSAARIDEISASPEAALALLEDNADVDYPLEDVRMPGCLGLLLRTPIKVQQVAERPADKPPPAYVEDPDRYHIDKVWDVLNYLLTGTPTDGDLPAAFLVNGGTDLEIEDEEDTHLRLLTPQQVTGIDQFLQSLTLDDLRARIDIPVMVKARLLSKPRGSDDAVRQVENLEHVLDDFEGLRTFITGTSEKGDGLLVMIN